MRIHSFIFFTVILLNSCFLFQHKRAATNSNAPPPSTTTSNTRTAAGVRPMPFRSEPFTELDHDVSAYAELCKRELGLPREVLKPWNCLEGAEVPITVDGKVVDASLHADLVAGRMGCDRPSWLGDEPCATYSFIQRRDLGAGVVAFLLCRSRKYSSHESLAVRRERYQQSGTLEDFRHLYDFDSLGLIWANLQTGKTCFFDHVGKVYGGYIASPDDIRRPDFNELPEPRPPADAAEGKPLANLWHKNARDTWRPPREVVRHDGCIRCHDIGPFKSSPYVQQVFEVPRPAANVPYLVVGEPFAAWKKAYRLAALTTTPIGGESQVCTRCHRVGAMESCWNNLDYAVGNRAPGPLSATAKQFKNQVWMPPWSKDLQNLKDEEAARLWHERYDAHVKKLRCCCRNPQAKGCLLQDLTNDPLMPPVAGTGPQSCE